MKKHLEVLYKKAVAQNHTNIMNMFEVNKKARLLDLGCDDGAITVKMAKKIKTNNIYGVEIVDSRIKMAEKRQITVKKFDLNNKFDFQDNSIDVIHANQVIEHLHNTDNFLIEMYRVLERGGYGVISTENASSWCNIFASIMGWQIFSLTNFSSIKQGIGNPFSLHRGDVSDLKSWNHVRILNIRGLKEYFEAAGFKVDKISGAGYFPLPGWLGNIDKVHSHFITFKIRKA